MKEAFPGWGDPAGFTIAVPADGRNGVQLVLPTPLLVLAPHSEHRLLVVEGMPANEQRDPDVAHASSGNLGLYGFKRHQGRWLKTSELPSFAWLGEYGEVGQIHQLDLGAGRPVIASKSRYCAQGFCQTWFEVFLLGEGTARSILKEQTSQNIDDYARDPCTELVEAAAQGASTPEKYAGLAFYFCSATDSDMTVQARDGDGWPDIEFRFNGQDFDTDKGSLAVKRTSTDSVFLLRYNGERYAPLSGKNPLARAAQ